jgi:hypothetical protein
LLFLLFHFQGKLKVFVDRDGGKFDASRIITGADRRAIEQLSQELEEQRELAANRLAELVCYLFLIS